RIQPGPPQPVQAFLDHGKDFLTADSIDNLVIKMNKLTGEKLLDIEDVRRQVEARDREIDNTYTKDLQITAMHGARKDRKSTRLNSSHVSISYAVFCLKKKKRTHIFR